MAPRAKRGTTGAVQSHADLTCWVCGGEADVDDSPWLCLCTTEERRVHKACATQRLHAGTEPTSESAPCSLLSTAIHFRLVVIVKARLCERPEPAMARRRRGQWQTTARNRLHGHARPLARRCTALSPSRLALS